MNDERIDFSSLDPSRDSKRWESMIDDIASKALASRRSKATVARQLIAWARPALAIAAAVAVVVWAGAFANNDGAKAQERNDDPALALATWAMSDEVPSASKILEVMGEEHDEE